MSDYDKEVLTASALLERLDKIEANATNIKHNFVGHTRALETKVKQIEDRVRTQRLENDGLLIRFDSFEKRIAIMQEKIDGID